MSTSLPSGGELPAAESSLSPGRVLPRRSLDEGTTLGVVVQRIGDYLLLVKARLSLMVLLSAVVAFWLASGGLDLIRFFSFAIGTFLVVTGANAFNQVLERGQDGRMRRTASRPLPAGRISSGEAIGLASLLSLGGVSLLYAATTPLTAALGTLAFVVYVALYTPLKVRSTWAPIAGAVSGALPPLMGWTATGEPLSLAAWSLFAILFLWQFPHTWAIAAIYREDYERAGYRMVPPGSRGRRISGLQSILACIVLLVVSLLPSHLELAGPTYLTGAMLLGVGLLILGVRFGLGEDKKTARQLLVASLFYLPAILTLLCLDRGIY